MIVCLMQLLLAYALSSQNLAGNCSRSNVATERRLRLAKEQRQERERKSAWNASKFGVGQKETRAVVGGGERVKWRRCFFCSRRVWKWKTEIFIHTDKEGVGVHAKCSRELPVWCLEEFSLSVDLTDWCVVFLLED